MMQRRFAAAIGICVVAVCLSACKSSPAVSSVQAELEDQIEGAEFEQEFHLRLGSFRLGLTRRLAGWAVAEDEDISQLLKSVKRVDIGTYRVVSLPPLDEIEPPANLMRRLNQSGWSLVLRTQDADECVWMFLREDGEGGISNIYIVALDEYELTMVSLEGRLDELLAQAIAEDPGGFAAGIAS